MPGGAMGKILRIDMGGQDGPVFRETPLGEYEGYGGRALTSAVISKEVPPLCHPPWRREQTCDCPWTAERYGSSHVWPAINRMQKSSYGGH